MSTERVTISVPSELLAAVDRRGGSRSALVQSALRHELERLEQAELRQSLEDPHPESLALADVDIAEWAGALPAGDDDLLDPDGGVAVRWTEGEGWRVA